MTTVLPQWLASGCGAMCADCRTVPAVTFWRSLRGPALCLSCAGRRLAALECRPI